MSRAHFTADALRDRVRIHRGFTLLEAIVAVAIATAFLGALAVFTVNLSASRERLARLAERLETTEAVFAACERALATAVVVDASGRAGIAGNEASLRITHAAVALGDDGEPILGDRAALEISFDESTGVIALTNGSAHDALAAPVRAMRVRYLNESSWSDAFDSAEMGVFPVGIEVSLWFAPVVSSATEVHDASDSATDPIEDEVIPVEITASPADRTRFFRIPGAPRVDALALRRIRDGDSQ